MATKRTATARPAKRKAAPRNSDEYLAALPEPARTTLTKLRATLRTLVPADTTESLSYGMPVFLCRGRPLLWFAGFSRHCSLFVGSATVAALSDELAGFKTFKGTIQFPLDDPPGSALLRKLVKARFAQSKESKVRPPR